MNKLRVNMKNGGEFYFWTHECNAKKALDDFLYRLRVVGIVYVCAGIESATLSTTEYKEIDEVKYE